MRVLCFDISTGGLSRALFDENLVASDVVESSWQINLQPDGAAILTVEAFEAALHAVMQERLTSPVAGISFSGFMHSSLLLDLHNRPLSPIFTWMDNRGAAAVDRFRRKFGSQFHERTGCRLHPMFPVFKAATFQSPQTRRIVSAKAYLIALLTGNWIEDHGTASATGLYNTRHETWDQDILSEVPLDPSALLNLVERDAIVGNTTSNVALAYGFGSGIPVIAGSGDGFLANLGSGCENPERMAVTLGTSSSVRQVLPVPILNGAAGTFCYRTDSSSYLLGCASNNGGNALDWARSTYGSLPRELVRGKALPTFIPLLNGERSPEWDQSLKASWHGIAAHHTARDLAASVVDGVVFNLAHYADIIERVSRARPQKLVLSGNGFLNRAACDTLAAVVDGDVIRPRNQGLASLRGAAVCALRALGVDTSSQLEALVEDSEKIAALDVAEIRERYHRYRAIRGLP